MSKLMIIWMPAGIAKLEGMVLRLKPIFAKKSYQENYRLRAKECLGKRTKISCE